MCREAWSRALAEAQRGAVLSNEPVDTSDGEPLIAATVGDTTHAGGP